MVFPQVAAAEMSKTVFVSILPQKFFVRQISGDYLNVEVMVTPGSSPATYEPRSSQMRKLSESSAYFSVGVPFENAWLKKITAVNPDMKLVRTDGGIDKLKMSAYHHHDEGPGGEHGHTKDHPGDVHTPEEEHGEDHHGGLDPHIWLSPQLVKNQAVTIAEALSGLYPEQKQKFAGNLEAFSARIDQLDSELRTLLAGRKGMKFMVFHPSWGYFAHEYGLEQIAVEIEGKSPKPAQLKELIEHARKDNIRVVFAQPQFSEKSAKLVAGEIGGSVVMIDPLAEDWFENMKTVALEFNRVLQ